MKSSSRVGSRRHPQRCSPSSLTASDGLPGRVLGGTVAAWAGGQLRVIMPDAAAASGQFIEVVPPRRIVFTWGWEGNEIPIPPGSSTVMIELEPADNGTLLRLTHSGLPADAGELHRKGWERYLDRLTRRATGDDPGPDRYVE